MSDASFGKERGTCKCQNMISLKLNSPATWAESCIALYFLHINCCFRSLKLSCNTIVWAFLNLTNALTSTSNQVFSFFSSTSDVDLASSNRQDFHCSFFKRMIQLDEASRTMFCVSLSVACKHFNIVRQKYAFI